MKFRFVVSVLAPLVVLLGCVNLAGQNVVQSLPNPIVINPAPAINLLPSTSAIHPPGLFTAPKSLCTCGCGSPTGHCSEDSHCDYRIQGSPGTYGVRKLIKTFVIEYPNEGECMDGGSIDISFYTRDIPVDAIVSVPRMVKKCIEKYTFKNYSYSLCGCKIDLCLPCEVVCDEDKKCEPIEAPAKLVVRVRRELSGGQKVADVWTNGKVQGLPNPAVLGTKMTASQINLRFKASPPVAF